MLVLVRLRSRPPLCPYNFRNKELQSHKQDLEIAFRNDRKVKRLSRKKSLPGLTYWFVRLSTTKPHRMSGSNNGNLFSQSSRGCKSKMRAGLPWGLSPWLPDGHPLHLAFLLKAYTPGASFCVSISSYSHIGLWPTLRDQHWNFFGRNDAKAETPVFWPPHAKSWLIGKDSDSGRDWEVYLNMSCCDNRSHLASSLLASRCRTSGKWQC